LRHGNRVDRRCLRQGNRVFGGVIRHGNRVDRRCLRQGNRVVGGIIRHDNREIGELVMWESDVVCKRE